jgi:small subunit ribosomal protein S8
MVMNDTLSAALSNVLNHENLGRKECAIRPVSILIKTVLDVLKHNNYLGSYQFVQDSKGGMLKLNLLGNINKCGSIKPRYNVKVESYEKFEKRYLPAKNFGILIVSTTKGVMTHTQAKEEGLGGKLLAYCY